MRTDRIITAGAVRSLSLALLLVLAMAPVSVAASHGPGAMPFAVQGDFAEHGHSVADTAGQHDATDHEHQLAALLPGSRKSDLDMQSVPHFRQERPSDGRSRDGPRRPPRDALI